MQYNFKTGSPFDRNGKVTPVVPSLAPTEISVGTSGLHRNLDMCSVFTYTEFHDIYNKFELVHLSHVLNNHYSINNHHSIYTRQYVYCMCTSMDLKHIMKIILMTANLPAPTPQQKISPKHLVC